MPNWVSGHYAIKGPKENVLAFLNEGIKNSGYEPKKDCKSAYEFLIANAKSKKSNYYMAGENRCGDREDRPANVEVVDGLYLTTLRPMPVTFLQYDTTNCKENMPKIAHAQKEAFGCVGWYDWGLNYLGTKWDTELSDTEFSEDDKTATFKFYAETAWSIPSAWLYYIKLQFGVSVFLCVSEEGGMFDLYGEIDGEQHTVEEESDMPKEDDFTDESDYFEAYHEWEEEWQEAKYAKFIELVENWE